MKRYEWQNIDITPTLSPEATLVADYTVRDRRITLVKDNEWMYERYASGFSAHNIHVAWARARIPTEGL